MKVSGADSHQEWLRCIWIFDWDPWQKRGKEKSADSTTRHNHQAGHSLNWTLTVQTCCREPVLKCTCSGTFCRVTFRSVLKTAWTSFNDQLVFGQKLTLPSFLLVPVCCAFLCISFLPVRRYASVHNSDHNVSVCLSIRPSVCPSVTCRYCVKTS